jgi:arylsulfatase A-like enzyme
MSTGSIGTPGAITPAGTAPQPEVAAPTEAAGASPVKTAGGPSRWAGVGAHAWVGIRYGVGAAAGMWVGDVLVLFFTRGSATWAQWLTGVGAALFVAATTALFVGTLLGPVVVPIVERVMARVRTWWQGLRDEQGNASQGFAAYVLTLVVLTSVWSVVTRYVVSDILYGFARADTMEAAMVASHLAFTATLAIAWPVGLRAARQIVDRAARVRGLAWILGKTTRVAGFLGACLLVPVTVLSFMFRDELLAAHWLGIVPIVAVVPAVVAVWRLPRVRAPWGPRISRAVLAVGGLALVGSVVAALRVHPESTTAQILGFDRALSGRVGYAAWVLALDFDRDGQISVLGGGDCAPFDPHRRTGAPDIPGNHIDEDCDGTDLSATSLRPRYRAQVGQAQLPEHPSIVLITIDALAAPRLKALGSPVEFMPRLDAFAESSRLFTHAFSQGPSTRLSFPSMFTSRWDSELTFTYSPRMPYSVGPKEKQIQDLMDDMGYDTVAVIPNNYFDKSRWPSVTRGFAHVDNTALPAGKHNASQVTDAALRQLSEQRERPLYMWVHYYDAHPPYGPVPGATYATRTDDKYYEAEIAYIDRELGRLLDSLQRRTDPTYVIITADHSTVFHPNPESRHFHYGYDLYASTLHVPLIVHGPNIKPGRVDGLVSTMDVAPTILDLLRAPESRLFNGWSLMTELLTPQQDMKRTLFHEYYLPEFVLRGKDPLQIVSVQDEKYNLILNRDHGNYELYDWTTDYYEQQELYEVMAHSPEVARLRSLLAAFVGQFDSRPDSAVIVPGEKTPEKTEL